MTHYILAVEDRDGNEVIGSLDTDRVLNIDQLVTVRAFNQKYISGHILEIIGEKNVSL